MNEYEDRYTYSICEVEGNGTDKELIDAALTHPNYKDHEFYSIDRISKDRVIIMLKQLKPLN